MSFMSSNRVLLDEMTQEFWDQKYLINVNYQSLNLNLKFKFVDSVEK